MRPSHKTKHSNPFWRKHRAPVRFVHKRLRLSSSLLALLGIIAVKFLGHVLKQRQLAQEPQPQVLNWPISLLHDQKPAIFGDLAVAFIELLRGKLLFFLPELGPIVVFESKRASEASFIE